MDPLSDPDDLLEEPLHNKNPYKKYIQKFNDTMAEYEKPWWTRLYQKTSAQLTSLTDLTPLPELKQSGQNLMSQTWSYLSGPWTSSPSSRSDLELQEDSQIFSETSPLHQLFIELPNSEDSEDCSKDEQSFLKLVLIFKQSEGIDVFLNENSRLTCLKRGPKYVLLETTPSDLRDWLHNSHSIQDLESAFLVPV